MAAPARPGLSSRKGSMRPPPSRAQTATPAFNGRVSPAESMASATASTSRVLRSPQNSVYGGTKRKERDFEHDAGEETNINVVVRCRGRSEREVRENSGVVVSADGVKGKSVELSMGPSALSNKTYHFDKVFSPAADQNIIFEEVVAPILDEVCGRSTFERDRVSSLTTIVRFLVASIAHYSRMDKLAQGRRTPCPAISRICNHCQWRPV